MKTIFFYLMKPLPDQVRAAVPRHVAYWHSRALPGYAGGPFADRSGGLILFEAESLDAAAKIVSEDPFAAEDLLEHRWLKEWLPE